MGRGAPWIAVLSLVLASAGRAWGADFELTPAETQRVGKHDIVIRANIEPGRRSGTVRAAMLIDAPPAVVFQMMARCADAVQYVPHLRLCRVRDRAADSSWELVEHD